MKISTLLLGNTIIREDLANRTQTLERIETEREDEQFPIPAEASIDYRGYQPRPILSLQGIRLVPKQPPGMAAASS